MLEHWIQQYVRLALQVDRKVKPLGGWYVDNYYGPAEWKTEAEAEPELPPADLLREAGKLADALPVQGYEPQRERCLAKQVRAMETVCRRLNGESFPLEEEVDRLFDIRPSWTPESQFEEALAVLDEALPGDGSVGERFLAWQESWQLAPERAHLTEPLIRQALDEARRRTRTFVDLPEEEGVETEVIRGKDYGAANWYLGNYRSRLELNVDVNKELVGLPLLMCHEAYPGHHTEQVMKEWELVRQRGYLEQCIDPLLTPRLVVGEGIATLAPDMVFTPEELFGWLLERLPPEAGLEPVQVDAAKVHRAHDLLQEAPCNAAIMLSEGRPDEEVVAYLRRYTLHTEDRIRHALAFLKTPLMEGYIFTYTAGKRLMQPLLQGPDRLQVFRRFLTEQLSPSDLVSWA